MLTSLILPLVALTTPPAIDAEAEVRAVYRKIERCMARRDCNTVIWMFAPEFHYTGLDGTMMDGKTMAKQMREMVKMMRNPRGTITVDEVYVNGDEATAWVTMRAKADVKTGDKWVPMDYRAKYIETLRKAGSRWLFTASFEAPMN